MNKKYIKFTIISILALILAVFIIMFIVWQTPNNMTNVNRIAIIMLWFFFTITSFLLDD